MIFSFGPRGLITYDLLGISGFSIYGLHSTLFSETITFFPIAYLTLKAILAGIDPTVEDMAFSLGSSRWRVFRTVTSRSRCRGSPMPFSFSSPLRWPISRRRSSWRGTAFPILPTQAYLQITGMFDLKGGAVALLRPPGPGLRGLSPPALLGEPQVLRDDHRQGRRPDRRSRASRPGCATSCWCVCLFISASILYFYVLLFYASIVKAFGADFTLTWKHYHVVFTEGLQAIGDTLIIAGIGMPLGGIYSVVVGYLVCKKEFISRQTMEIVSMINYSLPGTIVGIAYLLVFNDPPLMLTGTAIIIIACYVFRYGPTGIRTTVAILQQIDPSIEEASFSLGASSGTTFRRITLPLILPAFFAGLGVVFIRSMTAISATIFLISINWTLITVVILGKMTELELGVAAAFSILVVVIVFVVIAAIGLFLRLFRQPGAPEMSNILGG